MGKKFALVVESIKRVRRRIHRAWSKWADFLEKMT